MYVVSKPGMRREQSRAESSRVEESSTSTAYQYSTINHAGMIFQVTRSTSYRSGYYDGRGLETETLFDPKEDQGRWFVQSKHNPACQRAGWNEKRDGGRSVAFSEALQGLQPRPGRRGFRVRALCPEYTPPTPPV
jgi:hypothetical protein